ncbi:TrkH family potassium uptake protein [Clostridiaceae bacterium]|nr:TrkH family potassium uptake protein [Clostridiaceae bacterium]RKI09127.1 TrkH family potassium uptake protein [bacterium 1XD21-70]
MNYRIILYIIGWVLNIEAAFMLLPVLAGAIYQESALWSFVISGAACLFLGLILTVRKPKRQYFYVREGYVTVALSWIVLSIMGSLPFLLSGSIQSPVDALFETVSGFTTTGASILPAVEDLPKCVLLWRSFTHWIGGMGVLVFLLSLLKLAGGSHMNLMKAESPGPSVSKLMPKVHSTAKILYGIYIIMTLLEFVVLLVSGMPVFDALTTSFGTAGTGGFGIKNDSIAGYSPLIQVEITVFMILFGVNFNFYFLLLLRKWKQAFSNEEVCWYFIIILAAVFLIGWDIHGIYGTAGVSLRESAFQVGSIITTTGFATCDFNQWPELSRTILVMLMFVGACAGSTGGGIKVSRFIILIKYTGKELSQYLHPRQIKRIRMDGKSIEHEVVRNINVFLIIYLLIFAFSLLVLSLDGTDLITNFTAVAATFNNIGPGLELVGPSANFGLFSNPAKLVLIFDMLAGRLEIFPLLLLFMRDTWRKF